MIGHSVGLIEELHDIVYLSTGQILSCSYREFQICIQHLPRLLLQVCYNIQEMSGDGRHFILLPYYLCKNMACIIYLLMLRYRMKISVAILTLLASSISFAHDLVINNGRVMDPESAFDQIANIAIDAGQIVKIDGGAPKGDNTIDAAGLY